ncbi:T9SS type A sorting domain-containing protein [Cryomorphaceae bacterium 1068]|nr:T9SS type A sorting domain-containing protein [Cryomorphaceae bacterium 1068]
MKIDKGIYAIVLLCAISINAFAQNPFWTFPEQGLDVPGLGINPLPTDDYTGQEADYVHVGLKDPYGEILFFAVDGRLYDKTGEERSEFDDGSDLIKGTSEALVVPQPGSCNRFYIFQGKAEGVGQTSEFPHFSVYDDTLNILLEDDPNGVYKTSWNMVTDFSLISNWGNTDHGVKGVHFAATNEFANGERWVLVSSGHKIFRVHLTCNGLVSYGWNYTIAPGADDIVEQGWRSEMELFEDTANNVIRVATPYKQQSLTTGDVKVMVVDLDSITGNVIPGSRVDIEFPDQINAVPSYVHGMEFSPDGSALFFIHDPMPGYPSPFSVYDFSSDQLVNLNFTGISAFERSQIQISGSPGNYTLYLASGSHLGTLSDPDFPVTGTWNPNAIALSGGYSSNLGGNPSTSLEDIKRIVPDQIDYMDYDSMFVKASCDCCRKYAYAKPKQDTSLIVTVSDTWAPGLNGNPWDALSTDTIFIRDSIYVSEGVNLRISDLNFRFGKEGVIVVKRGNETTDGAVLTLTDSTHITTDFRCSELKYNCPDPDSDDCKAIFWQGIRVEGHDDLSQSISSPTKQGRLNMDKGSTLEFAELGILAGHEQFNQYGGGIVRIKDSFIKDCPTGIRFDKYFATDGTSEIFNLAEINNMHFFWTDTLLHFSYSLKYHVDIYKSSGITLRGNLYELQDWTSFSPLSRGIGINIVNSRVVERWLCNENPEPVNCGNIVRSKFLNMVKGINATSSGSTRTLEAGYGIYENNYIGIHAIGLENPKLLDNDFKVPNTTNRSGITLTNSTGYMVENNYFTSMALSPVATNIGIYVQNSGEAMNEIYNNIFKNIALGIASAGQNADCVSTYQNGLRWICNRFEQTIPVADIYVYSGNVSDDQGECSTPAPAGNIFSHTTNGFDIKVRIDDILTCNNVFFDIEYNFHDVTGGSPLVLRLEPLTYTNYPTQERVDPQMCPALFPTQNDCPIKNTAAPPGKGGSGIEGGKSNGLGDIESPTLQDYADAVSVLYQENVSVIDMMEQSEMGFAEFDESIKSEIRNLRNQEYYLWNGMISATQWDTLGHFPEVEVLELLNEYQPSSVAARFASALSIELGVEVPIWVGEKDNHIAEFDADQLALFTAAVLPIEIGGVLDDSFFNSAANTSALVSLYAENDKFFLPYPMQIEAELPDSFGGDEEGKANSSETDLPSLVEVRPNPFNVNFVLGLNYSEEYDESRVVIYDLLGRVVFEKNYGVNPQIVIDGSAFPSGVLIYSVFIDGELMDTGRIVKAE